MIKPTGVTVVVTNYNYAEFLERAIWSALSQTQPPDEVIVIDDASGDGSASILERYADRVRLFVHVENRGVVIRRNEGLRAAHSRWVVFLDADDVLAPDFLQATLDVRAACDANDVAFVYGDMQYFGQRTGRRTAGPWSVSRLASHNYIDNTVLLDRSLALAVGGYSKEMAGLGCEDWDLWLTLAHAGYRGLYLPQVLFHYNVHGAGITAVALNDLVSLSAMIDKRHPWRHDVGGGSLVKRYFRRALWRPSGS